MAALLKLSLFRGFAVNTYNSQGEGERVFFSINDVEVQGSRGCDVDALGFDAEERGLCGSHAYRHALVGVLVIQLEERRAEH